MEDMLMQEIVKIISIDENRKEEEVYKDMCEAIDTGFDHEDDAIKERWRKIPRAKDKPTPEEVIAYLAGQLN